MEGKAFTQKLHKGNTAALGCWMIPVENGIAGEGYWLAALPE